MTKIYCGNLPFNATEDDVRGLFEQYGAVQSVDLIYDRESGRPRGFGFLEMDAADAQAAIGALDGLSYGGRDLRVNEARPRKKAAVVAAVAAAAAMAAAAAEPWRWLWRRRWWWWRPAR